MVPVTVLLLMGNSRAPSQQPMARSMWSPLTDTAPANQNIIPSFIMKMMLVSDAQPNSFLTKHNFSIYYGDAVYIY